MRVTDVNTNEVSNTPATVNKRSCFETITYHNYHQALAKDDAHMSVSYATSSSATAPPLPPPALTEMSMDKMQRHRKPLE